MALLSLVSVPHAEAQGTLAPIGVHQFFTDSGAPCDSCLLTTYAAGTTTLQATYTDADLAIGHANANPIVLSTYGRATIFLSATAYKFTLTTSGGTLIWTVDNVTAIPAVTGNVDITGTAGEAIGAATAVYLSDGSGSKTAGRWYLADAANSYSSSSAIALGFAPTAIASGASGTIRLGGRITALAGLSAGSNYYVGTAGAISTTPGANIRRVGRADSTTALPIAQTAVALPDSTGAKALILGTTSTLTADRSLTFVTGDAARTITLTGNATLNQDVSSTGTPTFATVTSTGAVSAVGITDTGTLTINGIAYTFPASQSASAFLQTNGSGTLSWTTSGVDVQVFTSGTTNWSRPSGRTATEVIVIGGGAGGGSGRRGAAGTNRYGGDGGGGGGYSKALLPTQTLGATESVTVGIGGPGGTAISGDSTNGNPGTGGGTSSFGSWVSAAGGTAGGAGTNAAGPGSGSAGGSGTEENGGKATSTGDGTVSSTKMAGAGGGASSLMTAGDAYDGTVVPRAGGAGGTLLQNKTGGTAGTNGSSAGGVGGSVTASTGAGGAGGGGGGSNLGGGAFAGGNGGIYGGGGGGGGASVNASLSGKGGDGAAGIVIAVSW